MNKDSLKTAAGSTFHSIGNHDLQQKLFTVTPDIPILDALESVSCLLSTVDEGILAAAMGEQPLQDSAAWLTRHTLKSAKAVVDALIKGILQHPPQEQTTRPRWARQNGWVSYYTLDDVHIQRAPFGKYGPFPTANSLRQALDNIEAKDPQAVLVSRKNGLASDMASDKDLNAEYNKTLEKIAALGA